MVGFSKNGEIVVGEVAKRQAITNPDRTVRSVKRHMGEKDWAVDIDGKGWTPQEISAQILTKLKRDAEAYLGDTVTQAVEPPSVGTTVTSICGDRAHDISFHFAYKARSPCGSRAL